MRKSLAIVVGISMFVAVPGRALASSDDGSSDPAAVQAAKEIADARERANQAADDLFATESKLDQLQLQQEALTAEVAALEAQVEDLRATVEAVAVNRFTRTGTDAVPILTGFESAAEQAEMDVLVDVVHETSADHFDDFEAANDALVDKQQQLEDNQAATEDAKAELEQRRVDALAEVERLKEVEEQRLKDEAVRKALEAEEAERARQAKAKADAEAQQAAAEAEQEVAQSNSSSRPASSSDSGAAAPAAPAPAAPAASGQGEAPSATEPPAGDGGGDAPAEASGGTGGGQTGGGGVGGLAGSVSTDYAGDGWNCPVAGPVAFGDTWGAPRSGGRSHQGVDMIGERGLPIIAVVDGFVQDKTNELGGNVAWLTGADGNKYYYAHMDGWAASGQVTAGTVIGYLGQTGNARFSVAHLHFEIHPGGGAAVNPYPTVRAHC